MGFEDRRRNAAFYSASSLGAASERGANVCVIRILIRETKETENFARKARKLVELATGSPSFGPGLTFSNYLGRVIKT